MTLRHWITQNEFVLLSPVREYLSEIMDQDGFVCEQNDGSESMWIGDDVVAVNDPTGTWVDFDGHYSARSWPGQVEITRLDEGGLTPNELAEFVHSTDATQVVFA